MSGTSGNVQGGDNSGIVGFPLNPENDNRKSQPLVKPAPQCDSPISISSTVAYQRDEQGKITGRGVNFPRHLQQFFAVGADAEKLLPPENHPVTLMITAEGQPYVMLPVMDQTTEQQQQQHTDRFPLVPEDEARQVARNWMTESTAEKFQSPQLEDSTQLLLPDRKTIASQFTDLITSRKKKHLPSDRIEQAVNEYIERAAQSPHLNTDAARENFIKWWYVKDGKAAMAPIPFEADSSAAAKHQIAQHRFNRELTGNFIRFAIEAQAGKPLSENGYEDLARHYLDRHGESADNSSTMETFCKKILGMLKMIDDAYEAKNPGKTLSPKQRCFYLQRARVAYKEKYLNANDTHIKKLIDVTLNREKIFNLFDQEGATLTAEDVETIHGGFKSEVQHRIIASVTVS